MAPIPRPRKNIVCLGLNYAEHVKEGSKPGQAPEPAPRADLLHEATDHSHRAIRRHSLPQGDGEARLRGRARLRHRQEGEEHPRGEGLRLHSRLHGFDDVSARDLQTNHQQWYRGKSIDTFAPMGPYLVTKDEVGDPQDLDLWCKVNGVERQHTNTSDMIFNIKKIVAALRGHNPRGRRHLRHRDPLRRRRGAPARPPQARRRGRGRRREDRHHKEQGRSREVAVSPIYSISRFSFRERGFCPERVIDTFISRVSGLLG